MEEKKMLNEEELEPVNGGVDPLGMNSKDKKKEDSKKKEKKDIQDKNNY